MLAGNLTESLAIAVALLLASSLSIAALRVGLCALPPRAHRIGEIDGLRGYLALGVLFHHFAVWQRVLGGAPWEAHPSYVINNLGQAAVVVFFMITGALFYSRVVSRASAPNWMSVYVSRAFRLTPLYWLAAMIVILVAVMRSGVDGGSVAVELKAVLRWLSFAGMPDIAGYARTEQIIASTPWTLRYEWMFYLSLPLLFVVHRLVRAWRFGPLLILVATLVLCALLGHAMRFVAPFVLGMLAIEVAEHEPLRRILATRAVAGLGILALIFESTMFPGAIRLVPEFVLAVFFIPVVAGNSYFGILKWQSSIMLGELSYAIYLLHGIVMSVLFFTGPVGFGAGAGWWLLPLVTGLVVSSALLCNRYVERPGIALGKRIARSLNSARLPVPASLRAGT